MIQSILHSTESQVWSGPAASASPGNLLEMQFLGPTLYLLSQKLYEQSPAVCFNKSCWQF